MDRDTFAPAQSQAGLARELMVAIRSHQNAGDMMDEAMSALLGVNRTDVRCLDIIDQNGPQTAGQLAAESGLTTGAVTAVIDRLEKAGYVRRQADAHDRRKVLVALTEMTQDLGTLIYGEMGALGRALMGDMTAEQMKTIIRFLEVSRDMSREMAQLLGEYLPAGTASPQERMQRARAFHRSQKAMVKKLTADIKSGRDAGS